MTHGLALVQAPVVVDQLGQTALCVCIPGVAFKEKQQYEWVPYGKAYMTNKHTKDRVQGHDGYGNVFWAKWMIILRSLFSAIQSKAVTQTATDTQSNKATIHPAFTIGFGLSSDYNLHLTMINIQCPQPAVAEYQIQSCFSKSIYRGRQKPRVGFRLKTAPDPHLDKLSTCERLKYGLFQELLLRRNYKSSTTFRNMFRDCKISNKMCVSAIFFFIIA